MKRLRGCLVLVAILLIVYMFGKYGDKSNQTALPTLAVLQQPTSRPDIRPTDTVSLVTIIPTVVINRGFVTITPAPGTIYPSPTITDTPQPAATNTDVPVTPAIPLTPIDLQIYYTVSTVNLRSCPNTSCAVVEKIAGGSPLGVSGIAIGQEVDPGNPNWYKIEHSYTEEYGYSKFFSYAAPSNLQPNGQAVATLQSRPLIVPTAAPVQMHPGNCSTAVAMGLSPAQAAAEGLDRDNDGQACYGT